MPWPGSCSEPVQLNLAQVIFDAHWGLLKLREGAFDSHDFLLPESSGGSFRCQLERGWNESSGEQVFVRAHTWAPTTANKVPLPIEGAAGARLGEKQLLPTRFRKIDTEPAFKVTPLPPYLPDGWLDGLA
jgi:hypothetical protein